MNLTERLLAVINTLNAMEARKKIALGAGMLVTVIAVAVVGVAINKPTTQSVYMNLSREDLNSMSRVLSENGISFVTFPDKGSVEVAPRFVAQARMLLAEHGLPSSQESGYELFDRMNTIGLTSFMQDVTNKRAIEGELVRTIQMISGVSSARVHLVLPEKNVYRRNMTGAPTASVVLKTFGTLPGKSINAIRHMVASSVPGLEIENVTLVGADGTLLASSDDGSMAGTSKLVELERRFEQEAAGKISAAIGAHLGGDNYRVSVTAKLNSDKMRTDETVFDPESRVERSVQVVRESGNTQNKESSSSTSVDANLPDAESGVATGQSSTENKDRREELTNYEINQKKISVVSDGYSVESLSIALVVNKSRISELLGADATEEQMQAKVAELETIARSAVSASQERGDNITVTMVEFMDFVPAEARQGGGIAAFLGLHAGAMINAAGLILAAILFALLGIRPLLAFLSRQSAARQGGDMLPPGRGSAGGLPSVPGGGQVASGSLPTAMPGQAAPQMRAGNPLEQSANEEAQIRDQLEAIVSQGEERAAMAIKQWLKDGQAQTGGSRA